MLENFEASDGGVPTLEAGMAKKGGSTESESRAVVVNSKCGYRRGSTLAVPGPKHRDTLRGAIFDSMRGARAPWRSSTPLGGSKVRVAGGVTGGETLPTGRFGAGPRVSIGRLPACRIAAATRHLNLRVGCELLGREGVSLSGVRSSGLSSPDGGTIVRSQAPFVNRLISERVSATI